MPPAIQALFPGLGPALGLASELKLCFQLLPVGPETRLLPKGGPVFPGLWHKAQRSYRRH